MVEMIFLVVLKNKHISKTFVDINDLYSIVKLFETKQLTYIFFFSNYISNFEFHRQKQIYFCWKSHIDYR